MAWGGPILTDSGGFQVFSLRDTIARLDDDGVTFRSVYDGRPARFTPELVADVQRRLGSDIAMCLDVCPPADVPRADLELATELTTTLGGRQLAAPPRATGSSSSASPRAGPTRSYGGARSRRSAALGFDGLALGGLSAWGRSRESCSRRWRGRRRCLPADRPRYFMGIGDPVGILEVVERGVDMFDCVLPTRLGRTGSALTWEGRLNLKNARFARDDGPLDADCRCPACRRFSRAYSAISSTSRSCWALYFCRYTTSVSYST